MWSRIATLPKAGISVVRHIPGFAGKPGRVRPEVEKRDLRKRGAMGF